MMLLMLPCLPLFRCASARCLRRRCHDAGYFRDFRLPRYAMIIHAAAIRVMRPHMRAAMLYARAAGALCPRVYA